MSGRRGQQHHHQIAPRFSKNQQHKERSFVKGNKQYNDVTEAAANQMQRERSFTRTSHYVRDPIRRRSLMTSQKSKPSIELYKPPSLRPGTEENGPYTSLNVHAKEFTMESKMAAGGGREKREKQVEPLLQELHLSKHNNDRRETGGGALSQSKSSGNVPQLTRQHGNKEYVNSNYKNGSPPRTVHFQDEEVSVKKPAPLTKSSTVLFPQTITPSLKRSKSLGSGDMIRRKDHETAELGVFSPEVEVLIKKASKDPNRLSGRSLMDLVKYLFNRLVENTRYAEPAAKLCITIIELEKKETFLESLLNTCQEWFQQRERLLRNTGQSQSSISFVSASPRWMAYIRFLNEMYCQLKRRQLQLTTKCEGVPPDILLLTLLCECCHVSLKQPITSISEVECVFFVLTSVGRDMEKEIRGRMTSLMSSIRDAFLSDSVQASIRKTLLQLIEMHAARWQLPAQVVMYYYPGTGK